MGIPGFFKWLTNRFHYPDIVEECIEHQSYDENGAYHPLDETQPNLHGIEFDNLYLDMNSLIHISMKTDGFSATKSVDAIVQSIFNYIDDIFSIVRPRKLLYIAIDGVAPRAKLYQQRSRRFHELKEIEDIERIKWKILASGNALPTRASDNKNRESLDDQCITAGTSFMSYISDCLRYYIYNRLNTKPAWKSLKVIFSDANAPGEGEHKIINFIRRQCAQPDYDPETRHVLYGTDADLIILGLATHQRNVTIIRDKLDPSQQPVCVLCYQQGHSYKDCKGIPKENQIQNMNSIPNDSKTKYIFAHLSKLRAGLFGYFEANRQASFEWDFERFLDDWVFLCLLCGNDFLPDVPSLEIYQNANDDLLKIYMKHVSQYHAYLTNNGELNLPVLKNVLTTFGQNEDHIFKERHRITQQLGINQQPFHVPVKPAVNLAEVKAVNNKILPTFRPVYSFKTSSSTTSNPIATVNSSQAVSSNTKQKTETKEGSIEPSTSNQQERVTDSADTVRLWENGWHDRYYQKKFSINTDQIREKQEEIVEQYVRGLCWILRYYYHGLPSWDWYYPAYYAPFASDFDALKPVSIRFTENSKPFEPLEQLVCLTTPSSVQYLPQQWQSLISTEFPPAHDYDTADVPIDPNGKRYPSQYTVLLPFIREELVHAFVSKNKQLLTPEEEKRNEEEHDLLFIDLDCQSYAYLKDYLNENPLDISNRMNIPGQVSIESDINKLIPIGKLVNAPLTSYTAILNKRVLCVKYRA